MRSLPPEVRALHLRMLLDAVAALGDGPARAVRASLPAESLEAIEAAGRLDWLPATLVCELCDGVWAAAGYEGAERWGAASFHGAVSGQIARAFYEAGIALGGRNPGTVASHVVQVWPLLYRGCGSLVVSDASATGFRVVYVDVPPSLRRAPNIVPVLGALVAIARSCGRDARGAVDWSPESASCVYAVRWS